MGSRNGTCSFQAAGAGNTCPASRHCLQDDFHPGRGLGYPNLGAAIPSPLGQSPELLPAPWHLAAGISLGINIK